MKAGKKVRIGCLSVFVLFIVFSQVVSSCISFSMSDKEVEKYFADKAVKPEEVFYDVDGYEMHYEKLAIGEEGAFIFIHGTPGSWDAFIDYFADSTLYNRAEIISPDRPGFGKSSYARPVRSLEEQARLLKPILEAAQSPRILIGHSLGGPIAVRLAMDYPELVDGMILLAPALDPALEPDEDWFRKPMRWPVIGAIAPKIFRISNEELVFLEEELEFMLPLWQGVEANTITIQGTSDSLVDPGNGPFADSALVNAPHKLIMLEGQNHFLPWNESVLIKKELLSLMDELKAKD
ncbi:alpha/beta fold hydrolase [Roseivirga sp.]|uniref:alpha/beta fold hydrolase n=1 Tax=Roseivirga sp. TaxID=1964215 RepID=UPI003B51AD78